MKFFFKARFFVGYIFEVLVKFGIIDTYGKLSKKLKYVINGYITTTTTILNSFYVATILLS